MYRDDLVFLFFVTILWLFVNEFRIEFESLAAVTLRRHFARALHSPDTPHIPYKFEELSETEMLKRSETFYQSLNKRRSIRQISSRPVPVNIIKNVIRTAGTSPSGAYSEPWVFVVIKDPGVKSKIRDIIEQEEYLNYNHRMGEKWVNDLKFVNMNHEKPYLEEASYLINLFKSQYHVNEPEVEQPRVYNPLLLLL
uniref:Nitroreductase domain-containing protein n=1 Tax=Amphimedon queenslandica TaxID=400682 RepID=A0A1X7VQ22_AMPQE